MRRTFAIVLVLIAAATFFFLNSGGDPGVDVEALARRQARREAQRMQERQAEKTDLALLAKKGIGQEIPEYLVSSLDPSGYWFVGKPEQEAGVEIPFEPGQLPAAKSEIESLNPNPGFLGADACRECHRDKYDTFVHTAHHQTSRIANTQTISGSFEQGRNHLRTSDPEVHFTMIERDNRFYQRVSFFDWQFEVPFDLIIGSSKMAETYLYWHGQKLYQLNCTYLSAPDTWINSPGFIDGDAAYARPTPAGCLDCHTTYVELRKPPNDFTPQSLILGISCERCHGPGKDHVEFHLANPETKKPSQITVPSKLSRQAQMDVCGQCHTGGMSPKATEAFQFRPGDRLDEHYKPTEGHNDSAGSVHTSNQVARLEKSQCFQQSEMGCVECHDPHRNERGQVALFSKRCLKCHQSDHCGMSEELGARLADNCIDCHMPKRGTGNLRFETLEGNVFPPLRDHYIRVDTQATEEYLRLFNSTRK